MLREAFEKRRKAFEAEIAAARDAKEACDCAVRTLEDIRRACALEHTQLRTRLNELCAVARGALSAMDAVTRVDIQMRLNGASLSPRGPAARAGLRRAAGFAPAVACAVLAVWLFLDGHNNRALLAALAAAVSAAAPWRARRVSAAPPEVTGCPQADPAALARRMEQLLDEIDARLEADSLAQAVDEADEIPDGLLEAAQMLMEADLTRDGAFALRALPGLLTALKRKGISAVMYSAENARYFDLLPAASGERTVRPALLQNGRLIARGQAAVANW